ncbi:MAG: MBL fold metallo-hydrolase [Fimbriimonadaceae bacterium]
MTIQLLGTGAAEGIPAIFSDTRVSEFARTHGGKDVRTRCSALLDGRVKIDFGPDSLYQIQREGLDARDWEALVFTHSHDDHFSISELQYFLYPFSSRTEMPFPIYANEVICNQIRQHYPDWPFDLVQTRSFDTFDMGSYKLTPVSAHHMDDEDAQNLLFERDGKTVLYATDTGKWFDQTWDFLRGKRLDLLIIECTNGVAYSDYDGHLGVESLGSVLDRLRQQGTLDSVTPVASTHHSHNGEATYRELVEVLQPLGVTAGFDGLTVSV